MREFRLKAVSVIHGSGKQKNSKQVLAHIQENPGCIHTQLEVPCKDYRYSPGSILGTILD